MLVKIVLTLAFLAVMVGVGVYSRRHSSSVEGFVLGGRNVGPWLTAFAYGTSYFSAVVFVGYAGQFGWKFGLSSTWIGIGNAVIGSLLAWMVLARRTRLMTQHVQSRTMPDFFGARYGSEWLRVAASLIAFVFLIPYTAGVYMGISKLFEMSFGISYVYCAWTMAVLTAVYVILGGYKATAINDFIQGIIMLFGITAVIVAVLGLKGGLVDAVHKLSLVPADGNPDVNGSFAALFGPDPWGLLGVVVLTSLGTWGLPQMVSKFYSITDESAIRRGTLISTVFALAVAGGCYFLGGFGRLFPTPPTLPNGRLALDSIIPSMLVTLPDALIALVVLLVLSASMSTLASLVLTSSSTMTLDLIYRDKKSGAAEVSAGQLDDSVAARIERRKVVVMRVLIVFFIVISLMIALHPPHFIAQLMGISWGALAGAFLAPFVLGLYWRGVTRASVWACFVWGVGITVANMLAGNPVNPINCGAIAMLGGFAIVPFVSLVSSKLPADLVERVFACLGEEEEAEPEEPAVPEKADEEEPGPSGSQDVIIGARAMHLRELKSEVSRLKADNAALRDENAQLMAHFDLALRAAEDLRTLPEGGKLVVVDGWNLILGAKKEASGRDDLIAKAKARLAERPDDMVWIVFDGPDENSRQQGRLRISYTGGSGPHRADRMICDFLRMARFAGDASRIEVRTNDKDFRKEVDRILSSPRRERRG
jgi:SSS family solute:Na+ symporter